MASALEQQRTSRILASSTSLNQVLQSDSVRRLFNQPNIVIHAIPRTDSPTAYRMVKQIPSTETNNGINKKCELSSKPEVSINVINTSTKDTKEEENLLPSKNNGKSEILLVPITRKRKPCGHFEPCESLVCNVYVQQYEDEEGITPLISINISEDDDDVDAQVKKHCENIKCDALSIDHDRCRRGSIQLFNCDKCTMCDICGIKFSSFKARVNHKKCRRKQVYQHNIATPTEIFKCRMRERELQILEAARMKRSCDYLDPVTGFNRTMEALKKNDELIIIPKMPPTASKPIFSSICIKNRNNTSSNINSSNNANNNNSIKSLLGNKKTQNLETNKELTSEMISNIILSCQNSINLTNRNEKINRLLPKQIKSSDHLSGGTVNIMNTSNLQNQQQFKITELLQNGNTVNSISKQPQLMINTGPPLNSINLNVPQSQPVIKITGLQVNNKINAESLQQLNRNNLMQPNQSYAVPVKIMPIAELKSEPSLLHQKKGVPKFCVVPGLSAIPQIVPKKKKPYQIKKDKKQQTSQFPRLLPKTSQILKSGKIRPLQSALSGTICNTDEKMLGSTSLTKKQKVRKRPRKKWQRKGKFRCSKCGKRFSSLDYCRLHMNQHENNLDFFCKICEKGFPNMHYAKKHMKSDHREGEVRCEVCNSILSSMEELLKHMKCPEIKVKQNCTECSESFETCNNLDIHMKRSHGFRICTICKRQVAKPKIKRHLVLIHTISKNRSEMAFEKLSYAPSENDKICDMDLISETKVKEESVVKIEPPKKNIVDGGCLAKNRSIRRRNSKEIFKCGVCDRQFENEKQYQIHLANNPMKFTPCPGCGKKFHRKSECTEHCKSCNYVTSIQVGHIPKRRKSNPLKDESILKINNDITSQNSIDRKQDEALETNKCKKLKLNDEKIVQKEDMEDQQDKEDTIILKTTVEAKIVNGLKQDSSDYLGILNVIKTKNEDSEVLEIKSSDKKVLLLTAKQESINSNECTIFDRSIAVATINQDHNYQALR